MACRRTDQISLTFYVANEIDPIPASMCQRRLNFDPPSTENAEANLTHPRTC